MNVWIYQATVERVMAGDDLILNVDLGFWSFRRLRVQLYAIKCPSLGGISSTPDKPSEWQVAKMFTQKWVQAQWLEFLAPLNYGR